MVQYCRYCAFAFEGDCYYCGELDKVLSEAQMKRKNRCRSFALSELGDVITGKQYQPRKQKEQPYGDCEQLSILKEE